MKNFFKLTTILFLFALLVWSGCKTAKVTTASYVGKWNYVLSVPDGDMPGYIRIDQDGDMVTGVIGSDMGEMPLDNLEVDDKTISATFDFQGNDVELTGTFEGDILNGLMTVQGYELPFEGKKE